MKRPNCAHVARRFLAGESVSLLAMDIWIQDEKMRVEVAIRLVEDALRRAFVKSEERRKRG